MQKIKLPIFPTIVGLLTVEKHPCDTLRQLAREQARSEWVESTQEPSQHVFLFAMAGKEKVVAADEADFISVDSSTPKKPRGTSIPFAETSWSSPCLTMKRKRTKAAIPIRRLVRNLY